MEFYNLSTIEMLKEAQPFRALGLLETEWTHMNANHHSLSLAHQMQKIHNERKVTSSAYSSAALFKMEE